MLSESNNAFALIFWNSDKEYQAIRIKRAVTLDAMQNWGLKIIFSFAQEQIDRQATTNPN